MFVHGGVGVGGCRVGSSSNAFMNLPKAQKPHSTTDLSPTSVGMSAVKSAPSPVLLCLEVLIRAQLGWVVCQLLDHLSPALGPRSSDSIISGGEISYLSVSAGFTTPYACLHLPHNRRNRPALSMVRCFFLFFLDQHGSVPQCHFALLLQGNKGDTRLQALSVWTGSHV